MRCEYCDSDLPTRVPKCPFCGAPVAAFHENVNWESTLKSVKVEKTVPLPADADPKKLAEQLNDSKARAAEIAGFGMRWYYALIFVVLFLHVVMYVAMAYFFIVGTIRHSEYGRLTNGVLYAQYPLLRTVDLVSGFIYLGAAGYALMARSRLSKYKSNGPSSLMVLFVGMTAVNALRWIIAEVVINNLGVVNGSPFVRNIIQNVILWIANYLYFSRRSFLFDQ